MRTTIACPTCGRTVTVNRHGRISAHQRFDGPPAPCPGSGQQVSNGDSAPNPPGVQR